MSYFTNPSEFINLRQKAIRARKQRLVIKGFPNVYHFRAGDILSVTFFKKSMGFSFEGICLGIRRNSLRHLDTSILLRNVMLGVGIELRSSFYYNRCYLLRFLDYKRKHFAYTKSKLYNLRKGINQRTRV
jgi:ribosomal protein L19